jgi:hypothetical protein
LSDYQKEGDDSVNPNVLGLELHQPTTEKVQNSEEIARDERGVYYKFQRKSAQRSANCCFGARTHVILSSRSRLGAVARGKKPLRQFRFILPSTTFL